MAHLEIYWIFVHFSGYNILGGVSRLQQNSWKIANKFQSHLFSPDGILKEFLEHTAAPFGTAKVHVQFIDYTFIFFTQELNENIA